MLKLGVNDVWGGKSVADILANYTKLVQQARAQNPSIVLVVAQIAKMNPSCSTDGALTKVGIALDNAVPDWATVETQPNSPVFVADLWTNSDCTMAETLDCVHPNEAGAQKMGKNWFNALKGIPSAN
jgi:lysophospholipase L1-like esterase